MTSGITKAKLIPFARNNDTNPDDSEAVTFDFNPESLRMRVETGESGRRRRRGNQQSQHVGQTKATLSFDVTFDNTRPNDSSSSDEERLDIRYKTKPIADLLKAEGNGRNSAAKKVRFVWGTVIFNGIITSYDETFEFFSHEGVPLRSKISVTISENDFQYEVRADQVKVAKQQAQQDEQAQRDADETRNAGSDERGAGNNNEASEKAESEKKRDGFHNKLDDFTSGNLSLDEKLDQQLGLELGLDAGFDASLDFGVDISAGLDLSVAESLDVFGDSIFNMDFAANIDLGASLPGKKSPAYRNRSAIPDPARVQAEWSTAEAPPPGTKANKIASLVNQNQLQRVASNVSGDEVSTGISRSQNTQQAQASELELTTISGSGQRDSSSSRKPGNSFRGSPPLQLIPVVSTETGIFPQRQQLRPESRCALSNRPHWEKLQPKL